MNKKYLPIIALLAAALFLYWIKSKQRGEKNDTKVRIETKVEDGSFDRTVSQLIFSKHAKCRMDCRHIDESEVREILAEGVLNKSKIEKSAKGISYPLEGTTNDGQKVRIVFAPKENDKMVVVTVIDLETEFKCHCP